MSSGEPDDGKPYSGSAGPSPGSGPLSSSSSSSSPASGPTRSPLLPDSFRTTYLHTSLPAPTDPDFYTSSLASHLLVSFLPSHTSAIAGSKPHTHTHTHSSNPSPSSSKRDPPTLALVCPIEGSESHTLQTTLSAAALVHADVVQLDLVRTVGLGVDGDWGERAGGFVKLGMGNPVLVKDESEIRGSAPAGLGSGSGEEVDGWADREFDPEEDGQAVEEHEEADEEVGEDGSEEGEDPEEGPGGGHPHMISGPFEIAIPVGGSGNNPSGMRGGPGMLGGGGPVMIGMDEARDVGSERDKEGTRQVFQEVVDLGENDDDDSKVEPGRGTRPRIIYVQHSTAMNASFSSWWWALTRAVRKRNLAGKPTTIVLSCTPSFLHLGANLSLPAPAAPAEPAENPGLPPGLGELMKAMKRMREGPGGGSAGGGKKEDEFWKGSEEEDKVGRRKRSKRRLAGFQLGDER